MPTSGTAGNFTASQLQTVLAKADKLWKDNQQHAEYTPNVAIMTALMKEQTARLQEIENPEKDKTLRIYWIADCNTGVTTDDENDCEINGPEAESKSEDYALTIKKMVKFSVKENMGRTNLVNREDALAVQLLARMKEMDEYIAQTAVAKLNSFVGTNQFTGGIGVVDGTTTYIAPSYWTGDMYGYLAQVAIMNKLQNPFAVHGSNLFQQNWQAAYNAANSNQKDQLPKLQSIRSYWDMWNIDSVNSPDAVSYLIAKGAVAFSSKAYYPKGTPVEFMLSKRWSVESKSLPGVWYDVIYTNRCNQEDIIHDYKIKAKFDFFLNPLGCNEDVTGVLKIVCGAPAES
jgi:hypothetical protein